eukprot:g3003.t1
MDTMWDNADLFTTKSKPTSEWVNNMKVDPDFFGVDRKRNSRMVWRGHKEKKKHLPVLNKIEKDFFYDSMQDSRMEWRANEAKQYYPVPQSKYIGSRGKPKRKRCCKGMRPVCIQCRRKKLHAKVLRVCKKICRRRQFPMNRSMCLEDCAERLMRKLRYQNRRSANFYL